MASISPIAKDINIVTIKVFIDGKALDGKFHVFSIETISEVNKIPRAWVRIKDGEAVNPHFPNSDDTIFEIGKEIKLQSGYHSDEDAYYQGIIIEHGIRVGKVGSFVELECKNPAAKMTVARRTRTFVEMTDSDVINEILAENSLEATVEATSFAHPKTVQYRATDWDFILARAERNGFIITFDAEGKMTIGKPKFEAAVLGLTYGKDIYAFNAKLNNENQFDNATRKAWKIPDQEVIETKAEKPTVNEQGKDDSGKLAGTYALKEIQAISSTPLSSDELQLWSDAKLQKSHLSRIRGQVTFQGNAEALVGTTIGLAGVGDRFSGDAYISKVQHKIAAGNWKTIVDFGISPDWFSKKPDFHAPLADGLLPSIGGLQIAKVFQLEDDPEGEERILVKVPVFGDDADGIWARMVHLYATPDHGFYFIPEVGDEVIIGFLNDDPRYPVILGSVYSSAQKPAYTNTADNFFKAMTFKGAGGVMKFEFNEEKDIIILETPAGNRITLDDDQKKIILEDPNDNVVTLSPDGIDAYTPKDFKVVADGSISMTAKSAIDIKCSSGDVSLEGMNLNGKGKVGVKLEGTTTEVKGSAQAVLKGGVVMIN